MRRGASSPVVTDIFFTLCIHVYAIKGEKRKNICQTQKVSRTEVRLTA